MKTSGCPACSETNATAHEKVDGVVVCSRCSGLYTTRPIDRGDFYSLVRPQWHDGPESPENQRYFDFDVIGSATVERHHGWFDRTSRKITQTG